MEKQSFTEIQANINKALESINYGFKPENLYNPIKYSNSVGGKRIRPILAILSAQLFGAEPLKALPVALAIEIFHNSTLLHDDIMDNSMLRRGQPTVFKKWNTNTAILAGDTMIMQSYKQLSNVEPQYLKAVLDTFNKATIQVCEGQQFDLDYEQEYTVRIEDYIEMIRLKTSVLIAAAAKLGAIVGGANSQAQETLYAFGENLGLAFQLQDDYLDAFGDQKAFGKMIGDDIISQKRTFLLIKAIELSKGEYNDKIIGILNSKTIEQNEKIAAIIEIYRNLGVDKITQEQIDKYFNKAYEKIETLRAAGYNVDQIKEYSLKISGRKH